MSGTHVCRGFMELQFEIPYYFSLVSYPPPKAPEVLTMSTAESQATQLYPSIYTSKPALCYLGSSVPLTPVLLWATLMVDTPSALTTSYRKDSGGSPTTLKVENWNYIEKIALYIFPWQWCVVSSKYKPGASDTAHIHWCRSLSESDVDVIQITAVLTSLSHSIHLYCFQWVSSCPVSEQQSTPFAKFKCTVVTYHCL